MKKLFCKAQDRVKQNRIMTLILMDIVILNAVVFSSLLVRYEFRIQLLAESGFIHSYLKLAPIYTVVSLLVFAGLRLYRSLWEYASVDELRYIVLSAAASAIFLWGMSRFTDYYLPRSLPFLNFILLVVSLTAFRYSYRLARRYRNQSRETKQRTMMIGAGAGGAMVLQELQRSENSQNKVVCIIDDDPKKIGSLLNGVLVVGNRDTIPAMAEKYNVTDIILAIPTASQKTKRELVAICQKTKCKIQTLPALYQLASGQVSVQQIRDVKVEDLLGRDKVQVDLNEIGDAIRDKVVLVTGGGGSIGSELCRQVARQKPRKLVIFDIYENNAYAIQQELKYDHPQLDLVVLIGSVRDKDRVEAVFAEHRPDIVCHAAAHKHVPLMEDSPREAIKNNVFGTLNTARAADRFGAESFVLISTDKAVNPTNVMGASKRICEMIVQVLSQRSKTRFVAVRFGNVLGSNGSVIPLFRSQIERGGPVTVTHKDIIRYFMTISEAVSLVLQACVYAKGGEVFVLDMGEPVRIDDLARNMIRLSGFEPDVDIAVKYTGLRPGEKLYEELLMQDEGLDKTPNELIFIGQFNDFDRDTLLEQLDELEEACFDSDEDIRPLIQRLVKTYQPKTEEQQQLAAVGK